MADGGAVIVGGLMVEGALVVNRGAEVGGGYCPVCVCVVSRLYAVERFLHS